MRIGLLGPLLVSGVVSGSRLRALLIVLALEPGRVVPVSRLIDGVWGDDPPARATNALQVLVSRLRKGLDVVIESHPVGYRLVIDPDEVDASRFERLVSAARPAADPVRAAQLREALELWRGQALQDVDGQEFFQPHVTRLTELRLTAIEDCADAETRLGHDPSAELSALAARHPTRERLAGALMRALCAHDRTNEAVAVYETTRQALADELGTDPSAELSALHTSILRGTTQRPRTNLRAGLTSFVGRDDDVAEVVRMVGEYRLTTLTGFGGAGKTRLSVEAARHLLDRTPDGVWLVELAATGKDTDIAQTVLSTLGLRDQTVFTGPVEPVARLAAALVGRETVLVLDNCEHVLDAAAGLTERLLGDCPRLRILATSREPLGITGEALWPVEPLALPEPNATLAEAQRCPSVILLHERARAVRPGFALDDGTLADVVRICRAVEGIPLAIELSAARLRSMTTGQLAERLGDRFRLLTGGSRVALPRHQTLRAVVDWSWELLSERERTVLRRLAVFTGGVTPDAAEHVCGEDVFDVLTALADKSLLVAGERYRMLDTIKAYGLERLGEAGETEQIRQAHAEYFLALTMTADARLRGPDQLAWLDRLAADQGNIDAALRSADTETALRLVGAAGWYWWLSGRHRTGLELTETALRRPGPVSEETRAVAYAVGSLLSLATQDNWTDITAFFDAARRFTGPTGSPLLRLVRWLGRVLDGEPADDPDTGWERAAACLARSAVLMSRGDRQDEIEVDLGRAVAGFREAGDRWGSMVGLSNLADLRARQGDVSEALLCSDEALAVGAELGVSEDLVQNRLRQAQLRLLNGDEPGCAAAIVAARRDAARLGSPSAMAMVEHGAAEIARWTGDLTTARARLTTAETLVDHNWSVTCAVATQWGYLDAMTGDLVSARARHSYALGMTLGAPNSMWIAQVVVGVADLALRQGDPAQAARLLAASDAVRGSADMTHPDVTRIHAEARAALSETEFAEATRAGAAATVHTLLDIANPTLAIPVVQP
nr:BTAD domain-containing putative transcriptional regulator [Kibdelosporangium sp. MJ126-NF4]CEL19242.1 Signal transduction response regulator / Disease resistance domain-containing protein [Kibdelosporangium sp. MJ126-NF4]CTQ94959.1 Signal transduction response regulator / Disease resistance domain-containing protein [Kibdelosporangium sp. MJ126-NF4]